MDNFKSNSLPKISIITPVYNNAQFIEDCIVSILNQDYENLEYIVIDGGSTDGTVQIIEKYIHKLAYFISEKDLGQTHSLNKGFSKSTGGILAWLNADEEYLPGTLSKVGHAFLHNPDLDFYYGQRIIVDCEKTEIGRKIWPPVHPKWHLLYLRTVLPTDATFWSAKIHRLTGSLDEINFLRCSMDYDWLLRLSFNVRKWKSTPDYLSKYTERPDRISRLAVKADAMVLRNKSRLARERVINYHQCSKVNLLFGWAVSGLWCRILEKRFNFPSFISSIKDILLLK